MQLATLILLFATFAWTLLPQNRQRTDGGQAESVSAIDTNHGGTENTEP